MTCPKTTSCPLNRPFLALFLPLFGTEYTEKRQSATRKVWDKK